MCFNINWYLFEWFLCIPLGSLELVPHTFCVHPEGVWVFSSTVQYSKTYAGIVYSTVVTSKIEIRPKENEWTFLWFILRNITPVFNVTRFFRKAFKWCSHLQHGNRTVRNVFTLCLILCDSWLTSDRNHHSRYGSSIM